MTPLLPIAVPHPPAVRPDGHDGAGRSLRICLASMAPFVGGAEVAAERLAIGLREAGHEVVLLLGRSGAVQERLEAAGLPCVTSPMYHTDKWHWPRYWLARRGLARVLRRLQPDVIHSNDLPTHQIVSDAARGLGVPRMCHHRFPFGGSAVDWLNKFGAERHLFVSRALRDELYAQSDRLRSAPGAVVHDGLPLPPEPTTADREAARRQLGLPAKCLVVTIAGQVIERKGVADLIRAWALLPKSARGENTLVVVGDDLAEAGAYRRQMERLAGELACPARFVGFQKDVSGWLRASDVAVVPSHVEPLGNATLEAMSFALPVIGSAVGGIPEMVVHEETGLLVPPNCPDRLAAALARLFADPELRHQLGVRARQRCEELFSLEVHARNVLAEYRLALQVGRGASEEK
jgi:glycosyltransferase involved in cell wall biosynthesis